MVEEMKAMSKCLEKGIKIYPVPLNNKKDSKVNLVIDNAGKTTYSKQQYDQKKVHLKIYELYIHIAKQI